MNHEILEFPITLYGEIEKVNDTLVKSRCRIFYRLGNRNGTFITEEFAEELVSTLPYVPVKGIYDGDDFTDHGKARSEGRIYGIVPERNNFAWEKHLDKDGVERVYACCDVYLYSALYPEVSQIVGSSLSMELYEPTLRYHRETIDGIRFIVFDHGSFLGLQVLGEEVEPCFEGASFYSLQSMIEQTIQRIKDYSIAGGKSEMPTINFKLSDSQKHNILWSLLNNEYDEEHNWAISYSILDIYDDYCLVYNYENGGYERVYYTKDDEDDTVNLGEHVQVFIVDVTANEKETLDTLRKLNGDTYELVNENLTNADSNAEKCNEFSTKIEELNSTITTLNTEADEAKATIEKVQADYTVAQEQITSLQTENEALATYKKNAEDQAKEAVITEYADKLGNDVLETYRQKFDAYSVTELDMHLAYELKKTNSDVFNSKNGTGIVPKDTPRSGVEEILSHYKR